MRLARATGWLRQTRSPLRVLFIGSGAVNFGGVVGPWDHSRRVEAIGGVRIVAIADPELPKAQTVLETKRRGTREQLYSECKIYESYIDAVDAVKPDVAFIGVPPYCHGSLTPPLDIELQCLKRGVHLFVEKPVSVQEPKGFARYVDAVESVQKEKGLVVSVGYMFRYHPAIEKMREVLKKHGRKPLYIHGRYNWTYSTSTHPVYWDMRKSGGPIVEQATHFCDLLRYLGGEVDEETIEAICVPPSDLPTDAGYLSSVREVVREKAVPLEHRMPRVTSAHWKFKEGGVGTLTHGAVLQGRRYETQIDLWADGLRMILEEPYFPQCRLRVRLGDTDKETVYTYPNADPYLEEVKAFLDTVRSGGEGEGGSGTVRSTYRDSLHTYQLSWAIRRASEASTMT